MNKSWIANGFTAANALFGGLSIMMSISGEYHVAAICILIAMAADAFDGRVARALGTAGPMGVELDSLSDDISFGVAAGALMYSYQLRELGALRFIPLRTPRCVLRVPFGALQCESDFCPWIF